MSISFTVRRKERTGKKEFLPARFGFDSGIWDLQRGVPRWQGRVRGGAVNVAYLLEIGGYFRIPYLCT